MLKNTFIHLPGIGAKTEKDLWLSGITHWDDFYEKGITAFSRGKFELFKELLKESETQIDKNNPVYFSNIIPTNEQWRMFADFRDSVVYLDIETTGLTYNNYITTISLYDGKSVHYYINGKNLDDFKKDIRKYKIIVTFNGKAFDIPFIEHFFNIKINHAQIDLRYILRNLGFRGGLKSCEAQAGINRGNLKNIDGYFAVLLWNDYLKNRNAKALETLMAYNIEDTVNLEILMVKAYNLKISDTPFSRNNNQSCFEKPEIPFKVDNETVERIKRESIFF